MSEPFLPFAMPDIGEEEIQEVVDTLRSGWLSTGPKKSPHSAATPMPAWSLPDMPMPGRRRAPLE